MKRGGFQKAFNAIMGVAFEVESVFNFYIKKIRCKRNEKIRVIFITQFIPAWNKTESVYQRMKTDPRFEVFLVCVPPEINHCKLAEGVKSNKTFEYFKMHGYDNLINALLPSGGWVDLKKLNPDYVFYPRPYDYYMPLKYTSRRVSKYSNICLIMYGIDLVKEILEVSHNKSFCKNLYFYFSETASSASHYKKKYGLKIRFGIQKVVKSGSPALEAIMEKKNVKTDIWDFSDNSFRIIWTPRWTTEPNLGGTNFFKYKDFLKKFATEKGDISFLFRPHPLAFDNFIKVGKMTSEEVEEFRYDCRSIRNVCLDESEEYISTIWGSSVLISDISSFVIEYFVTGKPVIFCQSNMRLELMDYAKKVIYEGCYIANNEDDIRKYINEIQRGNDYLKPKRAEIILDIFGDDFENISKTIIDSLVRDHNSTANA